VGGLMTSTLLMLFVIPVLYYHGDKLNAWGAEKAREARGMFRAKKPADAAPAWEDTPPGDHQGAESSKRPSEVRRSGS
jgi:hypothetical protein